MDFLPLKTSIERLLSGNRQVQRAAVDELVDGGWLAGRG
jgi:hypothetical protein